MSAIFPAFAIRKQFSGKIVPHREVASRIWWLIPLSVGTGGLQHRRFGKAVHATTSPMFFQKPEASYRQFPPSTAYLSTGRLLRLRPCFEEMVIYVQGEHVRRHRFFPCCSLRRKGIGATESRGRANVMDEIRKIVDQLEQESETFKSLAAGAQATGRVRLRVVERLAKRFAQFEHVLKNNCGDKTLSLGLEALR
jgi:hypothetical protein